MNKMPYVTTEQIVRECSKKTKIPMIYIKKIYKATGEILQELVEEEKPINFKGYLKLKLVDIKERLTPNLVDGNRMMKINAGKRLSVRAGLILKRIIQNKNKSKRDQVND